MAIHVLPFLMSPGSCPTARATRGENRRPSVRMKQPVWVTSGVTAIRGPVYINDLMSLWFGDHIPRLPELKNGRDITAEACFQVDYKILSRCY